MYAPPKPIVIPKALIILGMHRSGTSLTAQWLAACGLDLGDKLLRASASNRKGHYEDMLFLNFHEKVLAARGLDWKTVRAQVRFTPSEREEAKGILRTKAEKPKFGWKEPRTVFFTEAWNALLEGPHYLIVYRTPEAVTASLFRRVYQKSGWLKRLWLTVFQKDYERSYLQIWSAYNDALLEFTSHQTVGEDFLLVGLDDLHRLSGPLLRYLNTSWGFDLEPVMFTDIYDEALLTANQPTENRWSDNPTQRILLALQELEEMTAAILCSE